MLSPGILSRRSASGIRFCPRAGSGFPVTTVAGIFGPSAESFTADCPDSPGCMREEDGFQSVHDPMIMPARGLQSSYVFPACFILFHCVRFQKRDPAEHDSPSARTHDKAYALNRMSCMLPVNTHFTRSASGALQISDEEGRGTHGTGCQPIPCVPGRQPA